MSAIRVTEPVSGVVVIGEEQRGVTRRVGGLEEQTVHSSQQPGQVIDSGRILAAQISLQVGH